MKRIIRTKCSREMSTKKGMPAGIKRLVELGEEKEINKLIAGVNDVEIISGGAKGADLLGEQYASNKNLHVKLFPADWAQYGKSAGIKRNSEMAQYADHCICFWDGQSKGTEKMISLASGFK